MRQFDLKEYLEHPEKKVVTKDGHSVRIICADADLNELPVVYLIKLDRGESLGLCDEHGRMNPDLNVSRDLYFAVEKHEGWVGLYENDEGIIYAASNVFGTEDEAKHGVSDDCVAISKIEWEE